MRNQEDLYFNPRDVFGDLNFTPVLSQENQTWTGAIGYVQDVMMQNQTNLGNTQIYACGSDTMIRSARAKTLGNGLNIKDFFADAFVESGAK